MPDRLLRPLQRTLRGRNAVLNVFEMWIALAGIITGVVFAYTPAALDANALSRVVGLNEAAVWTAAYAIAGVAIWVGLLKPSPKWEIGGLFILGSGAAANGIAIIDYFGLRGTLTALTLLALTIAAWVRALLVMSTALRLSKEYERDAAAG